MRKIYLLFLIIIFFPMFLLSQNEICISYDHLKRYKSIKKALKEPKIVYVLDIGYYSDKEIKKKSCDPVKLEVYLNQISKFQNLYYLEFDYLPIETIPTLNNLKSLETIVISRLNYLDWGLFFKSIAFNENIKEIMILCCDTVAITDDISKMKNLEKIEISYSKEITISDSLKNLKKLHSIVLNSNNLSILPIQIGTIPNLEKITIYQNYSLDIENAFNTLSRCKRLEYINIENNNIENIPDNICLIKNLKYLFINSNKLKILPMCLTELIFLEKIIWSGGQNDDENLLEEFDNKIKLTKLNNGNYVKDASF